jgi:hypothetical protein
VCVCLVLLIEKIHDTFAILIAHFPFSNNP